MILSLMAIGTAFGTCLVTDMVGGIFLDALDERLHGQQVDLALRTAEKANLEGLEGEIEAAQVGQLYTLASIAPGHPPYLVTSPEERRIRELTAANELDELVFLLSGIRSDQGRRAREQNMA